MFPTAWPGFYKFFRGQSLITFFNGSPASGWTRNFRLYYIELPWAFYGLKIKNLSLKIDSWVLRARVVTMTFMPASYVEFYYSVPG